MPNNAQEGTLATAEHSYRSTSNLGSRKEVWRMYLSENFCLSNSFVEDWLEEDVRRRSMVDKFPSGQYLFYFTTIVHYLTQLFVFIERLTVEGLYSEGVRVSITFNKMKDRKLFLDSDNHTPFMQERTTQADKISIDKEYSKLDILQGGINLSNEVTLEVLDYFKYYPPQDLLLQIQKQFLKQR